MKDSDALSSKQPASTSSSLLERVRARDPDAWQQLVTLYSPLVYFWILEARLQPADAADVGQNVFLSVARSIDSFRRDRPGDRFRNWLRAITRNRIIDWRRASIRNPGTPVGGSDAQERLTQLADAAGQDEPNALDDEQETRLLQRRAIERVRSEVEPATWEAFWRVAVEGQSPQEVAAVLGKTVNAVYIAHLRVRNRLQAELNNLMELDGPAFP